MTILSEQITRDIAQAFHLGLRQDLVKPEFAKELAVFLYGLAHLAEKLDDMDLAAALANPEVPVAVAESMPLSTFEAPDEEVRQFLQKKNEDNGYQVKSPLLTTAAPPL